MSFRLKPGKPIRRELKRIVRNQLQRSRMHVEEGVDIEPHVHEARKSVKKARAVVRLLRQAGTPGIRKAERRLRDAGRTLSDLRDAAAVVATLDRVRQSFPRRLSRHTHAIVHRDLARASARRVADVGRHGRVARAAEALHAIRQSAATWKIPSVDPLDLPDLLKTGYRAARKAMRRAEKSTCADDLHRWRKRVKTLWYQLRLLEGSMPALGDTIRDLDKLETILGEHHDLSVLEATIADDASLRRAVADRAKLTELSTAMQTTLRRKALRLGRRLLAPKPSVFSGAVLSALSVSRPNAADADRDTAEAAA
jgi:CHAD domain-containing protein